MKVPAKVVAHSLLSDLARHSHKNGPRKDVRDHVVFMYSENIAGDSLPKPKVSRVRQFFFGYTDSEVQVDPVSGDNTCPLTRVEYEDAIDADAAV